jgi:SagB-type dehydrogenase family enzyme
MFRDDFPIAWHFHRNSSRWPYNRLRYHPERRETPPFKEYLDRTPIPLPAPYLPNTPFADLLATRRSCRRFAAEPLKSSDLSALLHAAYGTFGVFALGPLEQVNRPVPSGGGLYSLEIYPVVLNSDDVPPGIYHYNPLHHALEELEKGPPPAGFLKELFMNQPYVPEASCLLIITSVISRSMWKYEDRGYRYILFEAGHVAQNLALASAVSGLGSLHLGGFFDQDLAQLLDLDAETEIPLYVTAVGAAETADAVEAREPRGGFGSF